LLQKKQGEDMNVPTVEKAELFLAEADALNPGDWVAHSRVAGICAKAIAEKCIDIDPDTAYVLGSLHDIGRRSGFTNMRHILDGYNFMNIQGYTDSARICLTHSFPYKNIKSYSGKNDCTANEIKYVQTFLENIEYDDYDKLIQLCDALSLPSGPTYIEKRLIDVAIRCGFNDLTIEKWKAFLYTKEYFDNKTSCDIYKLLRVHEV
jgi:hypothetical protein